MTRALVVAAAMSAAFAPAVARGGGMFLPTRGVRPTARAGAFVAGADDLGALWFNPAGLAALRGRGARAALVDASFVSQRVSYARIDSGFNEHEPVEDENPGLPIPTLGLAFGVGDDVVVAAGVLAPYAALGRYPADGPQRYSLVDLSDAKMAIVEVAAGWQVGRRLRLGAAVQNLVSSLTSTVVFNGCPGQTVCAPEDPEFDSLSRFEQSDAFSPSAVVGGQYSPHDRVRVGAAVQLPFRVSGEGRVRVVLPSSGFFDGASVRGDRASMAFTLPAMLRLGVEVSPAARWRAEVAVDVELWSMHDEFALEPEDVAIENAAGVGTYEIGSLRVPRGFDDSVAVQIGLEGQPWAARPLTVAFGYAYETSAVPDRYLSVMTVDGDKHLVAAGVGYRLGATSLYASASYTAMADRDVTPEEGRAPQLSPIRDDNQDMPLDVYVNWGRYEASWLTVGLSLARTF
ncbi:MAG: hypothetical protein D6689_06185 [Deltaproteobacteria bacterium]|nr:MAG: hypothetical protein D6689_06185 [Deltaproteobacteria bacterium]